MSLPELRVRSGRQTDELRRSPGGFGLGQVPGRLRPETTTSMICGYCSTGCSLNVHLQRGEAVNLTADVDYPVNRGMACPKGWEALAPLKADDRATAPVLDGVPVDWDAAMRAFCDRFKSIQETHGRDAVAFLGTGQICTEEMAFLGALAKFGMGMVHGDGNTRQCMATSVAAYKQSFGFDAPPYTYRDFEESDVIVLIGSNLCIAHPIMWERVLRNPHEPEIVVIDPRKTETAMQATQHYPLAPKSDLTLLYGIAHILIREDWVDRSFVEAHTAGFQTFKRHVGKFTPDRVAKVTGLSEESLENLVSTIHEGRRVSFWWTMGVNQGFESTRTAQAIINLALMTGNIGKRGTGANSITGQCNAMGSRLFSNTTNLLGGHDFTSANDRRKVARILGIDEGAIPSVNSLAYDQILDAIERGTIRGLWIIATNTAHSWIRNRRAQEILRKLDFLVVQDMYGTTETAEMADLLLPAAGWGEKEGTFINSERRIGLVKRIAKAPGKALSDFNILRLVASYWGCGRMFEEWKDSESVFQILKKLSRGQRCDITGIADYRMIDDHGGIQWPFPDRGPLPEERERRLFEDGWFFHADGKARFLFDDPVENPEAPDEAYPMVLLTGRGSSAQWHTQTRTGKSVVLAKLSPAGIYAELSSKDAETLGISHGDRIRIVSRRASIVVAAAVTNTVVAGQVFVPMHYEEANVLTHSSVDPHSRQPNYKSCAVRIEKPGLRR